jgi:hypothetical protein
MAVLAALACLAIAGVFVVIYWYFRWKANVRTGWPTVTGTIIASVTFVEEGEYGKTTYPSVSYSYEVAGRIYEGDRIEWSGPLWTDNLQRLQRFGSAHPVGSRVTVYYDPDNPANALLEPKALGAAEMFLYLAVLFGIVGLLLLALLFSAR